MPELDKKGLRRFGLTTGTVIAGLFGLVLPLIYRRPLPAWPWVVSGLLWTWALAAPGTMRGLFRVWMRIGLILGWINTRIILSVVFFLVLTPIGLVKSLAGRRAIEKGFDPGLKSYRQPGKIGTRTNMEEPF